MKNLIKIAALCLLSFTLLNNAFAASNTTLTAKKQDNTNYMFIDVAETGTLQKNADGKTYTLTLSEVDDWVTYFSDVPARITGMMKIGDFSKLMDKETKTNFKHGLNTGIIAIDAKTDKKVRYMVSLSNPTYNTNNHTISYTAEEIPGGKTPLPDNANFHHVSMFFDGICLSCLGGL